MKNQRNTRKSYRARFNQARSHMAEALAIMETDPDDISPADIDDLRSRAEQALQCVHEFSAYWNVVKT